MGFIIQDGQELFQPVLRVFRIDKNVELPKYAKDGDSGLDLTSTEYVPIPPNDKALVSTGIKIQLPVGYEGQIRPRSGLAGKEGITVLNTPGTIDQGYGGEIKVILYNTSENTFRVTKGMKIAQLVIAPVAKALVIETLDEQELEKTDRGENGFGSTGV